MRPPVSADLVNRSVYATYALAIAPTPSVVDETEAPARGDSKMLSVNYGRRGKTGRNRAEKVQSALTRRERLSAGRASILA